MPTDRFVSLVGSNTSPYDTWAKAATTVQAVLNINTAGDSIYIAPGQYIANNTSPNAAGVQLIGDCWSTKQDGGGNTSGVSPGFVYVFGDAGGAFIFTTNHDGSGFYNLVIAGGRGRSTIEPFTFSGSFSNGLTFENCRIYGGNGTTYNIEIADGGQPLTVRKCLLYSGGHPVIRPRQDRASSYEAGKIKYFDCFSFDANSAWGFAQYGTTAKYTSVEYFDCVGVSFGTASAFAGGAGPATNQADMTRCHGFCINNVSGVTAGTQTGNFLWTYKASPPTGWTSAADGRMPMLVVPVLGRGMPLNDYLSAFTRPASDIFGASTSNNQTPGPVEYQDEFTRIVAFPEYNGISSGIRMGAV